jgi:peptidyl-prolyl cis-trans isomerase C
MSICVNGVEIDEHTVNAEIQHHPAASFEEARELAARALVIRELLLQEAHRLEIEPPATVGKTETEEEAMIRLLIEREVPVPEPDEAACRRFFESHREKFRSPDLFEVSHILIAADPRDEDARCAAKAQAKEAIQVLGGNPEGFARLAAELSDCPSKHTGGNLGKISKGQTVPEFEKVLFRLQAGEITRHPVESRYGFHVIYLRRRIDGVPLELEQVYERIAGYLRESVRRRAISQYLQLLIGRADIQGIELRGTDSSLVQ